MRDVRNGILYLVRLLAVSSYGIEKLSNATNDRDVCPGPPPAVNFGRVSDFD